MSCTTRQTLVSNLGTTWQRYSASRTGRARLNHIIYARVTTLLTRCSRRKYRFSCTNLCVAFRSSEFVVCTENDELQFAVICVDRNPCEQTIRCFDVRIKWTDPAAVTRIQTVYLQRVCIDNLITESMLCSVYTSVYIVLHAPRFWFTENMSKNVPVVGGPSVMSSMVGMLLLVEIVSSTVTAANTTVKCFESNNYRGRYKTNILLDCSGAAGESRAYTVEKWIRYHAFVDDGIPANRVLYVDLENNNFQNMFTLPPMSSLKRLSFGHNNISSIENQALSNLRTLEELDLSHNCLKGKRTLK